MANQQTTSRGVLRRETKARMEANLHRRGMRERLGQIYFVEAVGTDRVKIGFAMHAAKRLASVAVICPVPLRLRALIDGPPAKERELHARFRAAWSHGEWFKITPELADLMAQHPVDDVRSFCGSKPPRLTP